jgi:hypothetical protein
MRHRFAAARTACGHSNTALRIATDRALNRAALLFRPALHQGQIGLVYFTRRKLPRQLAMRFVVLCDHHQSAGRAIQTVHNAGPHFAANS